MKPPTFRRWNNGDLSRNDFRAKRVRAARERSLDSPLEAVSSRLRPAGPPAWFPGWPARLSFFDTGDPAVTLWSEVETAEALFGETGMTTYWYIPPGDARTDRLLAVLAIPGVAMGRLEVVAERRDGGVLVRSDLEYTALGKRGNDLLGEGTTERMGAMLDTLAESLDGSAASVPAGSGAPASGPTSRTVGASHEIVADADLNRIFALACPVAELDWINDWEFDMVYSESGRNEPGCTFVEPFSGVLAFRSVGMNTVWHTTAYDAGDCHFQAVQLAGDFAIGTFDFSATELAGGDSRLRWSLTHTALNEKGDRILAEGGQEDRMRLVLEILAESGRRYLESGELYRLPVVKQIEIARGLASAAVSRSAQRLHAAPKYQPR